MQSEVIEAAIHDRVILMMGAKDTGKTTCTRDLANELFRRGYSVGVIDADVGQSDIGPPTTIGFGTVETVLEDLSHAVVRHLYFVGSISPKGHLLPVITGTRKMLDKAIASGVQKILIDTTGLVSGQLGRVLKDHKIAIVNPDVIVCLQRERECEHILKPYTCFRKPRIIRCAPDSQCRLRSNIRRRNFRKAAFRQYFSHAGDTILSLAEIGIFGSKLFSGLPLSPQHRKHLSESMLISEIEGEQEESQIDKQVSENQIIWGASLENELHLVTLNKLKYQQMLDIKKSWRHETYIQNYTPYELKNILVGVLDKNREYCSLGILRSIDFHTQQATVFTHTQPQDVAGFTLSIYKMSDTLWN